jgi:hypothetical protein
LYDDDAVDNDDNVDVEESAVDDKDEENVVVDDDVDEEDAALVTLELDPLFNRIFLLAWSELSCPSWSLCVSSPE